VKNSSLFIIENQGFNRGGGVMGYVGIKKFPGLIIFKTEQKTG